MLKFCHTSGSSSSEVATMAKLTTGLCCPTLAFLAALTPPHSGAQSDLNNDEEQAQATTEVPSFSARLVEEVVITGSRLRRDTFSSVSPLQIITTELSKEAGIIDPAEILQGSTASTGQQIDLTFQGFVLDNGPAASTVNLRGLGASRNLILINGRRVSPSGVEGAPAAPI